MGKSIVTAVAAVLLGAGIAYCEEKELSTPGEYAAFAAERYADNSLGIDARRETMERLAQAADRWPEDYALQWRTAQAVFAYGDTLYYQYQVQNYAAAAARDRIKNPGDVLVRSQALTGEQAKTLLELGVRDRAYADRAIALRSDGVEGQYYGALAIGLYSYGKSIVSALLEGLGPKYEERLNAALKIDKGFMDGAVFAAFGRYWYKLPWPKTNNAKSLALLLTAKQYDPRSIVVLDYLGDTSYALGKGAEARRYWEECLNSSFTTYNTGAIKQLAAAKLKYASRK